MEALLYPELSPTWMEPHMILRRLVMSSAIMIQMLCSPEMVRGRQSQVSVHLAEQGMLVTM